MKDTYSNDFGNQTRKRSGSDSSGDQQKGIKKQKTSDTLNVAKTLYGQSDAKIEEDVNTGKRGAKDNLQGTAFKKQRTTERVEVSTEDEENIYGKRDAADNLQGTAFKKQRTRERIEGSDAVMSSVSDLASLVLGMNRMKINDENYQGKPTDPNEPDINNGWLRLN